ncbi:hypothetical protein [Hyphomicrobium sp.]|uniref:hypothetical protein n=1 Tax=Hyphomicrobium sp. TaxID=82 RepID=UPI001D7DF015|nr:hypothetical protein [Hyphomicrobium sp.]MBY0560557.1 hypothetical protein [Hyphomicrobium sp.]
MDYLLAPFFWILALLISIVWWVFTQLLWIVLWLLLPVAVVAFIALRVAERVLGQETVRAWVKARSQKYGVAASKRIQRAAFALGVLPIRVLFWLPIYAVWHSVISLLWRPKWSPWQRAWAKRWRAETTKVR